MTVWRRYDFLSLESRSILRGGSNWRDFRYEVLRLRLWAILPSSTNGDKNY